ncbi:MAG: sigma-70 family RNA polymerase sigma factor [Candidatus Nanopelagicales bacterium]
MDAKELAGLLPEQTDALYRYVRSISRDDATAEDLVQETVTRALEKAESLKSVASLRPWLFRIAHNTTIDFYRRRREEPSEDLALEVEKRWREDDYTVDAAVVVTRAETADEVRDALVRIPVAYRSVVVLHDAQGWTSSQIADVMDLSLPATKQRLRRGRMMLVSAMARGHERKVATANVPLRCWDARRHVSAYLDSELPPTTATAVERHLARCPTCPPLYASLVSVREAMSELQDPDSVVPDALAQRIRGSRDR